MFTLNDISWLISEMKIHLLIFFTEYSPYYLPLNVYCFQRIKPSYFISYLLFLHFFQGIKDSKLINMLTFNDWSTGRDLPASIESFHVMLGRVNSYKRSFGNHPVTILCQ